MRRAVDFAQGALALAFFGMLGLGFVTLIALSSGVRVERVRR